ncbi:MAG TPA: ATP-binding protein [Acidimicrobiales bacterium]|nr:ATP-binding protein [Acidimicrobiales bacterium]
MDEVAEEGLERLDASRDAAPSDPAREAIRRSQRIASQLHQLIAASLTVAGLRNEHDIVESLAGSTRRVFDADDAVLSLETGFAAPLRGVAVRGKMVLSLGPNEFADGIPAVRPGTSAPWIDGEWLVAPVLEVRGLARGVLAVRRAAGEFQTEDREVLTLLAQMAATALGATELGREIESSETRLRVLVDAAPAGIVEVDRDGTVRWWNRAAAKIFAWPTFDEASDATPRLPETALAELATLWVEVVETASTGVRDLLEVNIRGRRRDLTVSAALLPTSDVVSILMLIDDVTDHRQLRAEVQHAQQMETRGRIASSVAHDFNNLLTLISGYSEILLQQLDPEDRSVEMVKDIQVTASRASMLTAQLQSIGRAPSLDPVVLDPVAVLQMNAEVLERVVGSEIETRWSLDSDAGTILVDEGQFEQMVLNLAINARDAMPNGGALHIGVGAVAVQSDQAQELGLETGDYVGITMSDTGSGMSEETLAHCFDTFFTTKGPFKGTGMGLAAARRLVEGSNGSITCASEMGVGTSFRILFPSAHQAVVRDTPHAVVKERPRGTATVLLAEDDDDLRRLMFQVLSRNGYEVVVAQSGEEALQLIGAIEGSIDLLVSDVVMAELSGPELAASLQAANPVLRVLLTSGTADESIISELLPGTAAFLAKPFRPSALIDKVHDLLSRR